MALSVAAAGQLHYANQLKELGTPRILALGGKTYHVQGIDLDANRLWVTSVDSGSRKGRLHEFALQGGQPLRSIEIQEGSRFHPGGIAADEDSVWIPVAEYRRNSSTTIQRRSKQTFAILSRFEVPDHIGCIAVTPEELIGGNWDAREFYIWDHAGKLRRKLENPRAAAYQDMKFVSGMLVASGLLPDRSGAIDWLEFPSLRLLHRMLTGTTGRGDPYTREGMAVRGGRLFLLPEDGPSRLFIFDLDR